MWIEQYLNSPLMKDKAGFADEKQLFSDCVRTTPDSPPPDSRAIFPVQSLPDGSQYLIDSSEQHTLIAGCTGSGKTRRVLVPAIMNAMMVQNPARRPSMFIFDVKGELFKMTSSLALRQGYEVVCIDLISPRNSTCGYEIVALAKDCYADGDMDGCEAALADLAAAISPLPTRNSSMDPFWARMAQAALIGAALYMLQTNQECFSFPNLVKQVLEIFASEISAGEFADEVRCACGGDSAAYRMIKTAVSGSEKTIQNVSASLLADLSEFMKTRALLEVMGRPMPKALKTITDVPTVIYFKTAENVPTLYTFGKLVFSQLYQRLLKEAGDGALARPFEFFMDEICNGQAIDQLDRMLAMCRSKNIRIHLVIQSLNQLEAMYGAQADTIRSNCGTFIVLRTTDPGTWDRVSSLAGVDIRGNALIRPRQLAHMELGRALILSPNALPYVAKLEDYSVLAWNKRDSKQRRNDDGCICIDGI